MIFARNFYQYSFGAIFLFKRKYFKFSEYYTTAIPEKLLTFFDTDLHPELLFVNMYFFSV